MEVFNWGIYLINIIMELLSFIWKKIGNATKSDRLFLLQHHNHTWDSRNLWNYDEICVHSGEVTKIERNKDCSLVNN